jgi:hypothetical protein
VAQAAVAVQGLLVVTAELLLGVLAVLGGNGLTETFMLLAVAVAVVQTVQAVVVLVVMEVVAVV